MGSKPDQTQFGTKCGAFLSLKVNLLLAGFFIILPGFGTQSTGDLLS
jgi:UPF0716 family protein affecting phage T7 exclusion